MREIVDAVVIGAGPNGLVAANLSSPTPAGTSWWSRRRREPGGAVRTGEVTAPGFRNDLFSAFYPLARVPRRCSRRSTSRPTASGGGGARSVLANPLPDGPRRRGPRRPRRHRRRARRRRARRRRRVAASCIEQWDAVAEPLVATLLGPFPPVRAGARLARRLGPAGLRRFGRTALRPRPPDGDRALPRRARPGAPRRCRGTPTSRPRPPAAASSAGCSSASARPSASRCPRAAPVSSPPPWCHGSPRPAAAIRCWRRGSTRSTCSTGGPPPCGWRTASASNAPAGRSRRRRCRSLYLDLLPQDVVPEGVRRSVAGRGTDPAR